MYRPYYLMLLAAACLLSVATPASAQKVTPHKITDSIYMLEGQGGNIGVSVGEDGILIIDTQFAKMKPLLLSAIAEIQSGDIDYIVNTHFHGDHTGGNEALGQEATIVAHRNVRRRMKGKGDMADTSFRNSLPTITYQDSATVHFNGENIRLIHLASGHTDTDTVVFFPKANVVHVGDLLFNGYFPFVDTGSGGDVEQYMKNQQQLIDTLPDDVTIIPGHGAMATVDDLKKSIKLMEETIAIIRKGMDAGKSKEELQKEGLPSRYDAAGEFFIKTNRWISIVYDSYSDK